MVHLSIPKTLAITSMCTACAFASAQGLEDRHDFKAFQDLRISDRLSRSLAQAGPKEGRGVRQNVINLRPGYTYRETSRTVSLYGSYTLAPYGGQNAARTLQPDGKGSLTLGFKHGRKADPTDYSTSLFLSYQITEDYSEKVVDNEFFYDPRLIVWSAGFSYFEDKSGLRDYRPSLTATFVPVENLNLDVTANYAETRPKGAASMTGMSFDLGATIFLKDFTLVGAYTLPSRIDGGSSYFFRGIMPMRLLGKGMDNMSLRGTIGNGNVYSVELNIRF